MKIDCCSDLHGHYPELEGGDLLIVAGDLTARHTVKEYEKFIEWMCSQQYKFKVVIAGNHDPLLQSEEFFFDDHRFDEFFDFFYLCDSGTEFEYEEEVEEEHKFRGFISYKVQKKLKIWGSPWTRVQPYWSPKVKAFGCLTEEELAVKYDTIPDDVDILVTHCPPYGILDKTITDEYVGSCSLLEKIDQIKPRLHVFGHIHEGYGQLLYKHEGPNTLCVNASIMDEQYNPVNKPIRVVL